MPHYSNGQVRPSVLWKVPAGWFPWQNGEAQGTGGLSAGRVSYCPRHHPFALAFPDPHWVSQHVGIRITILALCYLDAASFQVEWSRMVLGSFQGCPSVTPGFQHLQTSCASFWHFLLSTSRGVSASSSIVFGPFTPQ